MYHYVRDAARTAWPRIKARSCEEFERQLSYIRRTFDVVGLERVIEAYQGGAPLARESCLLTFDDGLADHVETVLPALRRHGLTGCFCIPARPMQEPVVLDVQKSQFVLAAVDDHAALGRRLLELVEPLRDEFRIAPPDELRATYARPGRYDGAETMFVKRLLQDGLHERPRRVVLAGLFAELVSDDEAAFARTLYLSPEAVGALAAAGMDVAGHGYEHRRLELLAEDEQRGEIERTSQFLSSFGVDPTRWAMCYPFGSRDETTLRLLEEAGCAVAFRDRGGRASPAAAALDLPRLDTNELPV